jgi:hypothetical protein
MIKSWKMFGGKPILFLLPASNVPHLNGCHSLNAPYWNPLFPNYGAFGTSTEMVMDLPLFLQFSFYLHCIFPLVKVGPSALINALCHCDLVRSFPFGISRHLKIAPPLLAW